jgi:hypothetical protein
VGDLRDCFDRAGIVRGAFDGDALVGVSVVDTKLVESDAWQGWPGSPTEGTDSLLALRGTALVRAGVRAGDLVAATEAGAITISVHCARGCTVRRIGEGPVATHGEGHITFVPGMPRS